MDKTWICRKCNIEKTLDNFYIYTRNHTCKECFSQYYSEKYKVNKEIFTERTAKYYKNNKDKVKKRLQNYFLNNKAKIYKKQKDWNMKNKNKRIKTNIKCKRKIRYGLTEDAYQTLVKESLGKCTICKNLMNGKKEPAIDHNHETGQVRNLLCGKCNLGIGLFKENIDVMQNAIEYLKKYNGVEYSGYIS